MSLDKIKARIRALSNKTVENGATEAEAMAAMAKVGELLELYNLNLSETFIAETDCIKKTLPYPTSLKSRPSWAYLSGHVANFTGTRTWTSDHLRLFNFFGMPEDVELAIFLMEVIYRAIENETRRFTKSPSYQLCSNRRRATTSFKVGLAQRLAERLVKPVKAAAASTGTALVVLKEQKVVDSYNALGMKLKPWKNSTRVRDHHAYSAGRAAGDRVNLNRPLTSGGSHPGVLT